MTADALERIHKAAPGRDLLHCGTCGQWIKQVPGGQGMTWVHSDSGAVVAPNPPLTDAVMSEVVNGLITKPERYVPAQGTYADGYLDALLDLLTGLGLFRPDAAYKLLREQLSRQKAPRVHDIHGGPGEDCWCGYIGGEKP